LTSAATGTPKEKARWAQGTPGFSVFLEGEGSRTVASMPHGCVFSAIRFIFYPRLFPIAIGSIPPAHPQQRCAQNCAGGSFGFEI
jgi:hypothetical protein